MTHPYTVRLTADQAAVLSDHGTRSIRDGITALIAEQPAAISTKQPAAISTEHQDRITITIPLDRDT